MAVNFRSQRIRTSAIVGSGSFVGSRPSILVYSASVADADGALTDAGVYSRVGKDTFLFVSGTVGGKGRDGITTFGGDVFVSGSVYASMMSGSLTKLADGTSFLVAGSNVTITTGSKGQVTIASAGGGSGSPGGSNNQVQFNDNGNFGGSQGLVYVGSAETLSAGSINITGSFLTVTGTVDIRVPAVASAFAVRSSGSPGVPFFAIDTNGVGVGFGGAPTESYEFNKIRGGNADKVLFLSGGAAGSPNVRNSTDVNFYVSGSSYSKGTPAASVAVFGGDALVSGTLYLHADTYGGNSYATLAITGSSLEIRNKKLSGPFVASVNTSIGNTVNFLDVRPNGAAVNTKVAIMPGIYAGPASPFASTDTNFFVGGTAGSKGGTTGGTAVFGGDLQISGSTYIGASYSNGVYFRGSLNTDILPDSNRVRNLGSDSLRFANVYTGDLHLKNERGDYTLIEEEDCLTIRFNKTGKRYRFMLERAPEFDEDPGA